MADAFTTPAGTSGRRINRRLKTLVLTVFLIMFFVGIYLFGYFITPQDLAPDFSRTSLPPSWEYPFGTDWLGRNMFYRTIKGLTLSITVGVVASAAAAVVATIMGISAAIGGPKVDAVVNWLIDLIMGVPHLVLLILISFALGGGLKGIIVGIAATHWTGLARVVRADALQIRNQRYVTVSRQLGRGPIWIMGQHMLPHVIPQFVVGLVLLFPHAILHESALSFLGFGFPPEEPSIGIILSESMKYLLSGMWWLAVFPGAALSLIVIGFDALGDNLKTLLDPYSAQE